MFTLKNNNIGKVGVMYERYTMEQQAGAAAAPAVNPEKTVNYFGKLKDASAISPSEQKKFLETLSIEQRKAIQIHISKLPSSSLPETTKWRASVSRQIYELNAAKPVTETVKPVTETVKPVTETVKPVTETVKPVTETVKPVTETAPVLAKTQKESNDYRGEISPEMQVKALKAYMNDVAVTQNFTSEYVKAGEAYFDQLVHTNISSLFRAIGKNREAIYDHIKSGKSVSRADMEKWGYSSNGALGQKELRIASQVMWDLTSESRTDALQGISRIVDAYNSGFTIHDLRRMDENKRDNETLTFPDGRLSQGNMQTLVGETSDVSDAMRKADNWNAIASAYPNGEMIRNRKTPIQDLEKIGADVEKMIAEKYKEAKAGVKNPDLLAELNKQNDSYWTGKIRMAAITAMANYDRNQQASGVGGAVTFETYIKGLTVSLGGVVNTDTGAITPGATIHYDISNTQNADHTLGVKTGVGISVPVFVPFGDVSGWKADKVNMMNPVTPDVQALTAVGGAGFGVLMYSNTKSESAKFDQLQLQLQNKISDIATKNVGTPDGKAELKTLGLDDYWIGRIESVYKQAGVTDTTSESAKVILLNGLVKSEVEKLQTETSNNEHKNASFRGFAIGAGNILGVTFPVGGLSFGKYVGKYSEPKATPITPSETVVPSVSAAPVAVISPEPPPTPQEVSTTKEYNDNIKDGNDAKALATLMLAHRGKNVVAFQNAYSDFLADPSKKDAAESAFNALISKDPQLKKFWNNAKFKDMDIASRMDETFSKTQGGHKSREIGANYRKAITTQNTDLLEKNKKSLIAYYNNTKNLLESFAGLTGINRAELQSAIISTIDTIDTSAPKALNVPANVAFSQINGDDSYFRKFVSIPAGQPILGTPIGLSDGKRMLALAFEPGAECFNVVIFEKPPVGPVTVPASVTPQAYAEHMYEPIAIRSVEWKDFSMSAGAALFTSDKPDEPKPTQPKEREDNTTTDPDKTETTSNPAETKPDATPVPGGTAPENGPATGPGNTNNGSLNGAPIPTETSPVAPVVPVAPPVPAVPVTPETPTTPGSSGTTIPGRKPRS